MVVELVKTQATLFCTDVLARRSSATSFRIFQKIEWSAGRGHVLQEIWSTNFTYPVNSLILERMNGSAGRRKGGGKIELNSVTCRRKIGLASHERRIYTRTVGWEIKIRRVREKWIRKAREDSQDLRTLYTWNH